jgi:hypothetical protein
MPIPYMCPVCMGTGLVSRPPGIPGDVPTWGASSMDHYRCNACGGTGVVWGGSIDHAWPYEERERREHSGGRDLS